MRVGMAGSPGKGAASHAGVVTAGKHGVRSETGGGKPCEVQQQGQPDIAMGVVVVPATIGKCNSCTYNTLRAACGVPGANAATM